MNEHTPGPWTVDSPPIEEAGRAITAYYDGEAWKDDAISFTRTSVANARLIAAAPALLELLTEIYEWTDYKQTPWAVKSKTAIAKATVPETEPRKVKHE